MTALVCTRNRGERVVCTVRSILACAYPCFELIVVDQSTNDETAQALAPYLSDIRLRYVRSETKGLGRARNIGLNLAMSDIVACTDDDCVVPADWLDKMSHVFVENPQVAVAFCNVTAGPHDPKQGFIPSYHRVEDQLLKQIGEKCTARGIGAGIALRRSLVLNLGGFDEMLGAGAEFPSCEDGDMAVRALLKGYQVYETASVAVLHYGFRTYAEGKQLSQRDWLGIGAAYAKPLKMGYWRFAVVPAYELFIVAVAPILRDILHLRRPSGLTRVILFIRGLCAGWNTPVDPETLRFLPRSSGDVVSNRL